MKMSRWFVLLGLVAALSLATFAQQQQPQQQQQPEGGRRFYPGRERDGGIVGMPATRPGAGQGWMAWRSLEAPSDEDWTKVESFMKENLPNTFAAYEKMEHPMRKEGARRRIYAQYKELMQLQEKGAEDKGAKTRYEARLDQAKKGDEILGLVMKWHNADPKDKPARRAELRQAVKQRIEAELKERQAQIDALRTRLEEQEKKLQTDKTALDSNLEKRVDFFIDHSAQYVNPAPQTQRGLGFRVPTAQEGVDVNASQHH